MAQIKCIEIYELKKYELKVFLFSNNSLWFKEGFIPIPLTITVKILKFFEKKGYIYLNETISEINENEIPLKEFFMKDI